MVPLHIPSSPRPSHCPRWHSWSQSRLGLRSVGGNCSNLLNLAHAQSSRIPPYSAILPLSPVFCYSELSTGALCYPCPEPRLQEPAGAARPSLGPRGRALQGSANCSPVRIPVQTWVRWRLVCFFNPTVFLSINYRLLCHKTGWCSNELAALAALEGAGV